MYIYIYNVVFLRCCFIYDIYYKDVSVQKLLKAALRMIKSC